MAASVLGLEVWGSDITRFVTDPIVQRRQARLGIREIRTCDLSQTGLPYEDAFCDVVNFSECLEHLNFNPLPVIKEFHRVLKPDGLVIVTTPNATRIGKRLSFLLGHNVFADLDTLCNGDIYSVHFREYSLNELCRLIEWSGFRTIERPARYLYPAAGVRRLAKKTIETVAPYLAGTLFVVGQK
jgi:SAM-dependent methyltransferase